MSWPSLTKNLLRELAGDVVYSRGRKYYLGNRVQVLQMTDEFLLAEVHGTSHYRVLIKNNNGELSFECNCPYAFFCKHSVATGLTAINRIEATKVQKVQAPARAQVRRLPEWEKYVRLIEQDRFEDETIWRPVFHIELQKNHWTLLIEKAYIRKDGQLGRRARIKENELTNSNLLLNERERFVMAYAMATENHSFGAGISLKYLYSNHYAVRHELGTDCGFLFELLTDSFMFLERDGAGALPLEISDEQGELKYKAMVHGKEVVCQPYIIRNGIETPFGPDEYILTRNPVWILNDTKLYKLRDIENADLLLPFRDPGFQLKVARSEFPNFLQRVAQHPDINTRLDLDEELDVAHIEAEPVAQLYLHERGEDLAMDLQFKYDKHQVAAKNGAATQYIFDKSSRQIVCLLRDREAESLFKSKLAETGARTADHQQYIIKAPVVLEWLHLAAPQLLTSGFELYGEEALHSFRVRRTPPKIKTKVNSNIDWFDLQVELDFDGMLVSLASLRKAIENGEQYITLEDGSTARLPESMQRQFQQLFLLGDVEGDQIKLARYHATLIDTLSEVADQKYEDADYRDFITQLYNFSGIESHEPPKSLNGSLRPYQKAGFNWLLFLQKFRFGGILADDMGLGKTVQTIALLLHEKDSGVTNPSLIVAPSSVAFNWIHELNRFAPSLKIHEQTGQDRPREHSDFSDFDIILTTYGTLRRDILFLREFNFHYIILDESQNIKNPGSQTAKATRILKSNYRVVLTGTPIENNTLELWSQMAFLNPGLLSSRKKFTETFANPIEKMADDNVAELLHRLIYPFILRRTKGQVASELPPKTETIFYANMSEAQEKLYTYWKDFYRATILQEINRKGLDRTRMTVLEGLMKLRQIACHPQLVEPETARDSGKFTAMIEQLEEILAEGHKVLIFSQFVKMLTIIRNYLDKKSILYSYLDGRTKDRGKKVNEFQENDDIKLFLISLRAGGVGLNLTAADYVIHFDPWWNPAVEVQATDRTHRIGQDKHVFVYKFITQGTVEEKVLHLQSQKQNLVNQLISTDRAFFKRLSTSDIEAIFK